MIPISDIVTINPGVVGTGGNPLALNGVIITTSATLPAQGVGTFTSAASVGAYFGSGSTEKSMADRYFLGYDNSAIKPTTLLFAPYANVARAAWNRSGSFAGVSLKKLNTIPDGTLVITVDGVTFTSATIALGAVTSFTAAATAITAAFTGAGKPTCTWDATLSCFVLTSSTTGAASTITYCTGSSAYALRFSGTSGAILSQGRDVDTPYTAMDQLYATTKNWVAFTTAYQPTLTLKDDYADWATSKNQRFAYIAWDTDAQAYVTGSVLNFAYAAIQAGYDGVLPLYGQAVHAAAALGYVASIDFNRRNGRATFAHKSQAGLTSAVTEKSMADALLANGYSFYGQYANATNQENRFFDGKITGRWLWLDSFIGEIYLNSQLEIALFTLLGAVNSIPFNEEGFGLIRSAMIDPINQALNAGIARAGVLLSESQKAQINQVAGFDVSGELFTKGYFLQILDPGAQVRGQRGSPIINFWYCDGQAVQKITLPSVAVL